MINRIFAFALCTLSFIEVYAQQEAYGTSSPLSANDWQEVYETNFSDSTLRIDYIFAGNTASQEIYVDELLLTPIWYGKRQNMSDVPLMGNGQLIMRSKQTGCIIYRHSFSTLFQEWLATTEAKTTRRAFENIFLVPMPKDTVNITIELYDYHQQTIAEMTHQVVPSDILIRRTNPTPLPYQVIHPAGDYDKYIKIAFVAEGYTATEMQQYLLDCKEATNALFSHEPFRSLSDRFQVVALLSPSDDSGVSEPGNGIWRSTAVDSHFDTFYSRRYLTTLHLKRLHDLLTGVPYEHIIILANTEHYGGGGIYNSYNLCYTRGQHFRPVVVHEFGHSFGGLADEYPYGDDEPMYFADTEPWEPNLTTLLHFDSKWKHLIGTNSRIGLYEGGGYLSKGVWRACENCRMRTNEEPEFCPVCQDALSRLIRFYTE